MQEQAKHLQYVESWQQQDERQQNAAASKRLKHSRKGRRDKGRHLLRPGVASLLGQFRRVWLQRAGRQADSFPSQSLHE